MGNELTTTQNTIPTPPSQAECRWIGSVFAASGFFTDARQAAQAITKILAGREVGLGPLASMTGIYIVKGRVTFSANAMAAIIQNSGRFCYRVKELTNQKCEIAFFEIDPQTKAKELLGTSTFTTEDAKQASLQGGDNWKKYPRNMLFARAMSNGAKWHVPAIFGGSSPYLPDELDRTATMLEGGEYQVQPLATVPTSPQEVLEARVVEDTSPLVEKLKALCDRTATDPVRIYTYYHAESFSSMNEKDLKAAIKHLELKAETEEIPA